MKYILLMMALCLVLGCNNGNNGDKQFTLDGAWTLRQLDDSTITIQQEGVLYTWHHDEGIANEWSEEIREIVAAELQKGQGERQSY